MDNIVKELQEASVGKVLVNEPLSKHTTIKIGGPADLFIEPDSVESLKKTLEIIKKHGIKWRAIGRGSNLLVSDNGIEGAVIKMGNGLNHMELDGTTLTVGAGYSIVSLAVQIARKGLSGLEFSSGIPGSIGGAVYMNAGAHGSDVSKVLTKAHILFDDGTFEWLSNEEMEYSYRTSILQKSDQGLWLKLHFN